MSWLNRLSNLLRGDKLSGDLDEELEFHLEARTRDNLDAGMTPEAARRDARKRFGNRTLAKERTHEMNIIVSMETSRLPSSHYPDNRSPFHCFLSVFIFS